jgi:hypothetical protein
VRLITSGTGSRQCFAAGNQEHTGKYEKEAFAVATTKASDFNEGMLLPLP